MRPVAPLEGAIATRSPGPHVEGKPQVRGDHDQRERKPNELKDAMPPGHVGPQARNRPCGENDSGRKIKDGDAETFLPDRSKHAYFPPARSLFMKILCVRRGDKNA